MNEIELKELILANSKPELATQAGMVYQVWEDGEITLQKSGELLWQRSLHMIWPGDVNSAVPIDWFPNQEWSHGYIFTDKEGALAVRQAILDRFEGVLSDEFKLRQVHAEMVERFVEDVTKGKGE